MTISSYNPKAALYDAFPQMKALSRTAKPIMECTENILMESELDGLDTSWVRTILDAAGWRITMVNDRLERLGATARPFTDAVL